MEKVYTIESTGIRNNFKCELFMDIGREFTKEDKSIIRDCVEKLHEQITSHTYKIDPIRIKDGKESTEKLKSLFANQEIYIDFILNEYNPTNVHDPWLIVTTSKGRIKIGWRKRVISIDWSGSAIQHRANDLFKGEEVTKDEKLIHAWGIEKAQEYINALLK